MTRCQIGPLEARTLGAKPMRRLNLLFPLYGKGRADFTSVALSAIRTTPKKTEDA